MKMKEKILQAALKLFAQEGYEGVSVRMIAEAVGVTKGALYKHYANKQAIFDSIVARMAEVDYNQAAKFNLLENLRSENPKAYQNSMIHQIKQFTLEQFKFWTEDAFASNFRKMLVLEQFRNEKMAHLLRHYLTGGVVDRTQELIKTLFTMSGQGEKDGQVLAIEYFAPMHLIMNLYYDTTDKGQRAIDLLERHIDYFMLTHLGWEDSDEKEN